MWGLFGKKKEPQDRLEQAEKLMNKGMSGLVMKTMVSKEQRDLINQSLDTAKQAQLASSGTVPLSATAIVISVTDTGKLINFDPIVVLVLNVTENDGSTYQKTLETLVSKSKFRGREIESAWATTQLIRPSLCIWDCCCRSCEEQFCGEAD